MSSAGHPVDNIALIPRRAYITTSAFQNDFYTYTVTVNPTTFVRTGTLAANVVGATASTCPANRILRETGRRLYPDANPGISTLLVGVYDAVSGLTGLIDPNAPRFAIFNSDKANYMANGIDPATSLTDQGAPVYTRGTITSGAVAATGAITATTTVTGGTGLIATTGQIRSATATVLTPGTTVNIDGTLGQVFTLAQANNQAVSLTCTTLPPVGSIVYVVINQAGATTAAVSGGTGVRMANVTPPQNKTTTVAFVCDGNALCAFGNNIQA